MNEDIKGAKWIIEKNRGKIIDKELLTHLVLNSTTEKNDTIKNLINFDRL